MKEGCLNNIVPLELAGISWGECRLKELVFVSLVVTVDGGGIEVDLGDRSPCELESSDLEGDFRTVSDDAVK